MYDVIAIVGPTASGKSSLAFEIAKRHNGEIVSCDSMQIYQGMDIGTAKATQAERDEIVHHMTDLISPDIKYSCSDYARDASAAIDDIISRGKLPVICGGTGLYLDALLFGSGTADIEVDEDYKKELEDIAQKDGGKEMLHSMLCDMDPEAAQEIHMNNVKRVIRALLINRCAKMTKAEWNKKSTEKGCRYNALIIGLNYLDREELYRRIELRVDEMISDGLIEETKCLFDNGYLAPDYTAAQAIGYKEILPYVKGELDIDSCIMALKVATRRYAKRQLTWFSKYKEINWIFPDESEFYGKNKEKTFEDIVNNAEKLFINCKKCSII